MKLIPIQKAYQRLFERQATVPELELHANGHCAHIGKLSPGCLKCFVPDNFYCNFVPSLAANQPAGCQVNCPYCPDPKAYRDPRPGADGIELSWEMPEHMKQGLKQYLLQNREKCVIPALSFSGGGDPLLRFDMVCQYMKVLVDEIEPLLPRRPWHFLYTNGLAMTEDVAKKCGEIGLDEVRFHLGASNFSERVYANMEIAAKYISTISVETPAWPPHRDKLFEMLPRIEAIGVQHLNLGQVELSSQNKETILKAYPDAEFFQVLSYQMDDGGLVYDLMREVVDKGYSFSVLDCSGLVKAVQRGRDFNVWVRDVAHDGTDLGNLVDFEKWLRRQVEPTSTA